MLYLLISFLGIVFFVFQLRYVKSPPAEFPPATLTTKEGLIYELGPYQRFSRSGSGSMLRKEVRPCRKASGFALYERGRQFFIQPFESGLLLIRPGSQLSLEAGSETLLQPTDFIVYNDHILSFGS